MNKPHQIAGLATRPHWLITRPQPQAGEWVARLQLLGCAASALPLLGISDAADPVPVRAGWQRIARRAQGGEAMLAMVMFVSPIAVERFFALRPAGQAWPADLLACGTGPGTRAALMKAGVPESLLRTPAASGRQFDSEALWAMLQPELNWAGSEALIVRGEDGRDWLADTLRHQGAEPHFVEAYRRTAPVLSEADQTLLLQALAQPGRYGWLFSSSEAVAQLTALAPQADWSRSRALVTHPRIAEAARRLGMAQVRLVSPSPDAVAAAEWPVAAD